MLLDSVLCETGVVTSGRINSVRIKVTERCPFTCFFCHHEGNAFTSDIPADDSIFFQSLKQLKNDLNLEEAHFTGGEPTAHNHILELTTKLTEIGFKVKMTSNGQFKTALLEEMVKAGLAEINISVHTLSATKLAKIQSPHRSTQWGETALKKQFDILKTARSLGIGAKINAVISDKMDVVEIKNIITFAKENNLGLRLLDDLSLKSRSIENIISLLKHLGAIICEIKIIEGSSSYTYGIRLPDGFEFKIKSIRKQCLNTMCIHCDVRDMCKEWFYGIRIEQKDDCQIVRLCLHRQDYPSVQNFIDFFHSKQYEELLQLVATG